MKVIGTGSDRIKLSWDPPAHNPEAAELYVVSMRVEGGAWEEVKRTKHTKALVTGLKSKKKYELKVLATNSVMISLGNMEKTETEPSKAAHGAALACAGAVGSPLLLIGGGVQYTIEEKILGSELSNAATVGIFAATAPLSLLLSPVATPIATVLFVKWLIDEVDVGDLTPVSDEEDT